MQQYLDLSFSFLEVMPPDEWHFPVNNSIYTNYIAKLSLLLPKRICELLNCTPPIDYEIVANKMYLPFDEQRQYHPEYDGFSASKF